MFLSNFINRHFRITGFKLLGAKILYKIVHLFFRENKRKIFRNGIHFEIDLSEGIDLSLFIFGSFQKHVTDNKLLRIPENAVIFDVGANVGVMSLLLCKNNPGSLIHAFEPTHYALKKFMKNMDLNPNLKNRIQVTQCFVSKDEGDGSGLKAYSSWNISGSTGEKHGVHGGTAMSAENVSSIRLDDYCINQQLTRLDFIKIDTDGHELDVLLGAEKCIAQFRPSLVFELGIYVMEERNIHFKDYLSYFNALHYRLFTSKACKPLTAENYTQYVPKYGTIDVVAIPQ